MKFKNLGMERIAILVFAATVALPQTQSPADRADITFEEAARERHYQQPLRPQFHYTPIQGHIGDATGLIYYAGEYHLFNMYDEWSRRRAAHKQWGHAISTDLIHWRQLPALLDTALDNKPGSGSGVVDWNNSSGLRSGPEKTLLIFYTDYKRGTCIAYSRDRGRTWTRLEKNPVIAGAEDARDPTVFWYAPASEWRMIRYEKKGFAFYKSRNLMEWTWLSRVEGFYECPDLIELAVLNSQEERRWVLIDGDGSYVLGMFDGQKFVAQTGKLRVDYGTALYAGQVWKRTLEGGAPAYQMFWMRFPFTPPLTWNGQMSFPVELTLRSFPEGVRLCRTPIDEINNLRVSQQSWRNEIVESAEKTVSALDGDLLDIRAVLEPTGARTFGLSAGGRRIYYSVGDRTLHFGDLAAPLTLEGNKLSLRILVDRSSVEVFAGHGEVTFSAITLTEERDKNLNLFAVGGKMRALTLDANRLESIWRNLENKER